MTNTEALRETKKEAYETIGRDPRAAFPEFNFMRKAKGWASGNALKLDGGEGSSVGKVWIYDNNPGYLYDYRGGESVTFWDYFERRRGSKTPLKDLADVAGVALPSPQPDEKPEFVAGVHPRVLRACLQIFTRELGESNTGKEVMRYLREKRGYSAEIVEKMGIGALPDTYKLQKELYKLPLEKKYADFFVKKLGRFGAHRLAIPCFGERGRLEGFIFRTIEETKDGTPKYRNMPGMETDGGVMNFGRGTEEIVVVEGVVDALLLKAHGRANVVSLIGCNLNDAQIAKLAERAKPPWRRILPSLRQRRVSSPC